MEKKPFGSDRKKDTKTEETNVTKCFGFKGWSCNLISPSASDENLTMALLKLCQCVGSVDRNCPEWSFCQCQGKV